MPIPFDRSMRALDTDGVRGVFLPFLIAVALLAAWTAWLLLARIGVYEVSDQARVEVHEAVHPIDARAEGRVVATGLVLGRDVRANEVLVELDADEQRLRLEEEQTRFAVLSPQIEALRAEIAAEENALDGSRSAAAAALDEARAQLVEVEAPARLADEEATRVSHLRAGGLVSEVDELRARAEAEKRRATVESLRLAIQRLERNQLTDVRDRQVRVGRLRSDLTRLQGQVATTASAVKRLENEIERRLIRAPIAGRLDAVQELRTGAFVAEGQKLGAIVSAGRLRIIAEFQPSSALGRIRRGQHGQLRLAGFPWTQYGAVAASVENVAGEIRSGTVRVELSIAPDRTSAVPIQHGMPGSVEVEVERVSPATLVLRAIGRLVTRPLTRSASVARTGE